MDLNWPKFHSNELQSVPKWFKFNRFIGEEWLHAMALKWRIKQNTDPDIGGSLFRSMEFHIVTLYNLNLFVMMLREGTRGTPTSQSDVFIRNKYIDRPCAQIMEIHNVQYS